MPTPNPDAMKAAAMKAVAQDGHHLRHVSEQMQADKDVVLAAVKRTGTALQFASTDLKSDLDIILAAVHQNRWALDYAEKPISDDVLDAIVAMDASAATEAATQIDHGPVGSPSIAHPQGR